MLPYRRVKSTSALRPCGGVHLLEPLEPRRLFAVTVNVTGPSVVVEGSSLSLSATSSGTSSSTTSLLNFSWSVSYDGPGRVVTSSSGVDNSELNIDFSQASGASTCIVSVYRYFSSGSRTGGGKLNGGPRTIFSTSTTQFAISVTNLDPTAILSASGNNLSLTDIADVPADLVKMSINYDFDSDGRIDVSAVNTSGATQISQTVPASFLTSGVTRSTVTLDDGDGGIVSYQTDVNVPIPVASLSLPVATLEESEVMFSAAGSGVSSGTIATYQWDTSYDGESFRPQVATSVPSLTTALRGITPARSIALRVVSDAGAVSEVVSADIRVRNAPPTATLTVADGTVRLSNPIDTPSDLSSLTYSFDLDADGVFEYVGPNSTYTLSYDISGDDERSFVTRVTDRHGDFTEYTGTLRIRRPVLTLGDGTGGELILRKGELINIPASISQTLSSDLILHLALSGPAVDAGLLAASLSLTIGANSEASVLSIAYPDLAKPTADLTFVVTLDHLSLSYVRPSVADVALTGRVVAVVEQPTKDPETPTPPAPPTPPATPTEPPAISPGASNPDLPVDETGSNPPPGETDALPSVVYLTDPANRRKLYALVKGTSGADALQVLRNRNGRVQVSLNGTLQPLSPKNLSRIVILGLAGNDQILAGKNIHLPVVFSGGSGDDSLVGGAKTDLIIGGSGADTLSGGLGGDLLIAGELDTTPMVDQLLAALDELNRGRGSLPARASRIWGSSSSLFSSQSIRDTDVDLFSDSQGRNLLISESADTRATLLKTDLLWYTGS